MTISDLIEMFNRVNYYHETDERLPCFSRCIVTMKNWFDALNNRWFKQRIVDELGANLYNYCRFEFNRNFDNACIYAFKGLKCLKQAEVNVIRTHNNLLECLKEKAIKLPQLMEYYRFPANESIPCLFKCFADKSQLYNDENNWIVSNWLLSFGPVRDETVDITKCRLSKTRRIHMDICAIMYQEYNCWERLNYNFDSGASYKQALKKLIRI